MTCRWPLWMVFPFILTGIAFATTVYAGNPLYDTDFCSPAFRQFLDHTSLLNKTPSPLCADPAGARHIWLGIRHPRLNLSEVATQRYFAHFTDTLQVKVSINGRTPAAMRYVSTLWPRAADDGDYAISYWEYDYHGTAAAGQLKLRFAARYNDPRCHISKISILPPRGQTPPYLAISTCSSGQICYDDRCCTPQCQGKMCGSDGCGGSCGNCLSPDTCINGLCQCPRQCAGKNCGQDGCGGSCGECTPLGTCINGQCVCPPQCAGKNCGPDGCRGSCGTCPPKWTCSAAGQCQCTPKSHCPTAAANECRPVPTTILDDGCGNRLECDIVTCPTGSCVETSDRFFVLALDYQNCNCKDPLQYNCGIDNLHFGTSCFDLPENNYECRVAWLASCNGDQSSEIYCVPIEKTLLTGTECTCR